MGSGLMTGLNGPSEQTEDQFRQTDGQALEQELTGEPLHSFVPAQRFGAPFFQSWYYDETHATVHFGKQSLRNQTHLDPNQWRDMNLVNHI